MKLKRGDYIRETLPPLPTHCLCCGAVLMASLTVHEPDCKILELILEYFPDAFRTPSGRIAFPERR